MAVTSAEFIVRFQEFASVETESPGYITTRLDDAESFLDEAAFGSTDRYERAVYYYAAALMVDTPYGTPMGLTESPSGKSNRYRDYYNEKILPLILRRGQITGGGLT